MFQNWPEDTMTSANALLGGIFERGYDQEKGIWYLKQLATRGRIDEGYFAFKWAIGYFAKRWMYRCMLKRYFCSLIDVHQTAKTDLLSHSQTGTWLLM